MTKDRFELRGPILNPNLLKKRNIDLKLVISKILSIAFIIATFLLSHINVTFWSILVWLNLSEILSKHGGFEYTNVIFRAKLICFNEIIFK